MKNDSWGVDVSSHRRLGTRTPLPGRVAWLQIAGADCTYFKKARGRRGALSLNTFLFLTRSCHLPVLPNSSPVCPMPPTFLMPHLYTK